VAAAIPRARRKPTRGRSRSSRNAEVEKRLDAAARRARRFARLPAVVPRDRQAPQLTRADLAALIGVRLAPLLQGGAAAMRRSSRRAQQLAATWIVAVAAPACMEMFAEPAFQLAPLCPSRDSAPPSRAIEGARPGGSRGHVGSGSTLARIISMMPARATATIQRRRPIVAHVW